MLNYLHNHPEFKELLRAVEHQKNIDSSLVEKDYWIMHCLYGPETRKQFEREYQKSTALYYQGQPAFNEIISLISKNLSNL